jgi:hypothetical protein
MVMDENQEFVTTFRWLDRGGEPRVIEIYAEPTTDARVWAYARDGENLVLVGAIRDDGKFYHLVRDKAVAYGLDTEAAWNDLFQVCWSAHKPRIPLQGPF